MPNCPIYGCISRLRLQKANHIGKNLSYQSPHTIKEDTYSILPFRGQNLNIFWGKANLVKLLLCTSILLAGWCKCQNHSFFSFADVKYEV